MPVVIYRILFGFVLITFISKFSLAGITIDSTFIHWNRSTFNSLLNQVNIAKDEKQRSLYNNRTSALKSFLEIDSVSGFNSESVRYSFLRVISLKIKTKVPELFIIEANESGYVYKVRNYLVWYESDGTANVESYIYSHHTWILENATKMELEHCKQDLKEYITAFGQGINLNDDVVITRVDKGQIKESEFYLIYTLSPKICFSKIFK